MTRERLRLPAKGPARVYTPARESDADGRRDRPVRRKEGHDALIQTLAGKGATVVLEMVDDFSRIQGRLLQSDRFTISVEVSQDLPPVIVFKHAIRSMTFDVPAQNSHAE